MCMGDGWIQSYYKTRLKLFGWSVLILFLQYCLPDHTSSHSHAAAGREGVHDSAETAERGIYLRSREKAAGILEWLQITVLSLGDQTGARIQLLVCQSQIQLNYTLICFTKQPVWRMQSPPGPCPVARATLCGHPCCHMHKAWRGRAAGGRPCSWSVMLRSSLALVPVHAHM